MDTVSVDVAVAAAPAPVSSSGSERSSCLMALVFTGTVFLAWRGGSVVKSFFRGDTGTEACGMSTGGVSVSVRVYWAAPLGCRLFRSGRLVRLPAEGVVGYERIKIFQIM